MRQQGIHCEAFPVLQQWNQFRVAGYNHLICGDGCIERRDSNCQTLHLSNLGVKLQRRVIILQILYPAIEHHYARHPAARPQLIEECAIPELPSGGLLGCYQRAFEPGVLFMPFAALPVLGSDDRRHSMAVLCLSCGATSLAVITAAQTKLYWYLTPTIPFLAIAAGLGVSDGLRWIKAREPQLLKSGASG